MEQYLEYGNEGIDCKGIKWERAKLTKRNKDITGQRFNKLLALFKVNTLNHTSAHTEWLCLCDCSNLYVTNLNSLQSGNTKSCGCWHGKKEKIKKPNYIDLTGQRFDDILVLEKDNDYAKERSINQNRAYWKCQLDDGRVMTFSGTELRQSLNGKPIRKKDSTPFLDGNIWHYNKKLAYTQLIGETFNYLTVIDFDPEATFSSYNSAHRCFWKCRCVCGNITSASTTDLKTGEVISCGCIKKTNIIDLTGQHFDLLEVIGKTDKRRNRSVIWTCRCECGNFTEACSEDLLGDEGHRVRSCGCLRSKGERKIQAILNANNILYEKEKTFDTCHLPDSKKLLRFDFYVNNSFLLEFDGEQHFYYSETGWNTREQYETTHQRDLFKNNWCQENHIPIKRIPYTDYDKITIESIMSDEYLLTDDYYNKMKRV